MNRIVTHVEKERILVSRFDTIDRFVGESVGEVFSVGPVLESRDVPGTEKAIEGVAPLTPGDIFVEPVVCGEGIFRLAPEVPLAEMPGVVPCLAQRPRKGCQVVRQVHGVFWFEEVAPIAPGNEVRDADPRRVLPGHHTRPRGRADRTGGVGVGEARPFACKPIQVRRLVEWTAVTAEVPPTQVVGQDTDNVRSIEWHAVRVTRQW